MEIIVYQMGKVGSTSIVDALNRAGAAAYQSHFLDIETFRNAIQRFANPQLPEESAHHLSNQLQRNLVLHNKVIKYLQGPVEEGAKLGVVTLVRDPLEWFYSNLAQNIFDIRGNIRNWLGSASGETPVEVGVDEVIRYLDELFDCFDRNVSSMGADIPARMQKLFRDASGTDVGRAYRFFYGQVSNLARPHYWFEQHWKPLFGMDILGMDFDSTVGHGFYENERLKCMLIRFENLEASEGALSGFFGLDRFSLKQLNRTRDKSSGNVVAQARSEVSYPDGFRDKFYSTAYCRKFNYS